MYSQSQFNLKRVLFLLKPHLKELLYGGAFMLIYVLCWPILAWLAGRLIPAIGNGDLGNVIQITIQALFVFLIQKLSQFSQDTLLANPALSISQTLRNELFKKLQKIEIRSISKLSTGDITYRLTEDAERVGEVIYKTIQDTTPSLLQLIAVLTYMVFLDWQISLATLILAPLITLLISNFGVKVMSAAEKSQEKVSQLASLLGEAIQGIQIIRAFTVEDWMQNKFENQVDIHRRSRYRTLKLLAMQHPVIGFIEASGILTILIIGSARIQNGGLDAQAFSSYFAALLMLIDPISHLTTNFNELQQGKASLKRLIEIEGQPIEKHNKNISKSLFHKKSKHTDISINNLNFNYESGKHTLNNISISIKSGEVTALVGPSGAGKSTIFSLLLRFIYPNSGTILLNNEDLTSYDVKEVRKEMALVPQSISIFSGTILEAISFGRKVNREKIIKCAKIANAHNFITNLSKGYETYIEERGTNLSGGQLQRISIARALIGNPSVLLLDEATSALDAESEAEVQLGLKQAMKDRTVIVIAHRLSTVQEADQIIFLENGQIIEKGSHLELLNCSGRYSELCEKQFLKGTNS
tara:strand:+ start:2515 stop:4266 length:1752 start_codon:yes stop_codon:yes gene_type:complete